MGRSIDQIFRSAAYAPETGEAGIILLEISHPELNPTIYLAGNAQIVTSHGNDYLPYPFNIVLPNEQSDQMPTATIEIDNIHHGILKGLRALSTPPSIGLHIVVASDPDKWQLSLDLTMIQAKYDQLTISCTLSWEKYLDEPYPGHSVTPGFFPAVFAIRG